MPETLFEEYVGKQVIAGMALREPRSRETRIRQVLLDMTKIQMTRKLILPSDAWRAKHWVREGLRALMDGGSVASETAKGLLNYTISLRHSDDMAKAEQPVIVQALMNAARKSTKGPRNVRKTIECTAPSSTKIVELAKLQVNAGYYRKAPWNIPRHKPWPGPISFNVLLLCGAHCWKRRSTGHPPEIRRGTGCNPGKQRPEPAHNEGSWPQK